MRALDLIQTSRDLTKATRARGRPRQSNLRRAVSTTYYAIFHCLARSCADTIVRGTDRSQPAWRQAYRALDHGTVKRRCDHQGTIKRFPQEIHDFANVLVDLQAKRHSADYDPDASFRKSEVLQDIDEAAEVIRCFGEASLKDRRAFAVYVLLNIRK